MRYSPGKLYQLFIDCRFILTLRLMTLIVESDLVDDLKAYIKKEENNNYSREGKDC